VKSPRDDRLDRALDNCPPGTIVGGESKDSTFNRIARQIETASGQFDAVNSNRAVPNVLALVNLDDMSDVRDLDSVLTGNFYAESGEVHPIYKNVSEGKIRRLKGRIDMYLWFDMGDAVPSKRLLDTEHADRIWSCSRSTARRSGRDRLRTCQQYHATHTESDHVCPSAAPTFS
jgi:hypothetical protein